MVLIYQIPGGSSERWHGNHLGDLLWVDPAICGHLVSRHLLVGNDGTAGKQQLWTIDFGISRAIDEFCQFVIGQGA